MWFSHWWFARPTGEVLAVAGNRALSDAERRELAAIERHLSSEDPEFAHLMRTGMASGWRAAAWTVLAVVCGGSALAGALTGDSTLLLAGIAAAVCALWLRHHYRR